jgi:hypothetical protein
MLLVRIYMTWIVMAMAMDVNKLTGNMAWIVRRVPNDLRRHQLIQCICGQ